MCVCVLLHCNLISITSLTLHHHHCCYDLITPRYPSTVLAPQHFILCCHLSDLHHQPDVG